MEREDLTPTEEAAIKNRLTRKGQYRLRLGPGRIEGVVELHHLTIEAGRRIPILYDVWAAEDLNTGQMLHISVERLGKILTEMEVVAWLSLTVSKGSERSDQSVQSGLKKAR